MQPKCQNCSRKDVFQRFLSTVVNGIIDSDVTIDFDTFIRTINTKIAKMKLTMQAQENGIDGIMDFMEKLGLVHFNNAAGMMKWANFVRTIRG